MVSQLPVKIQVSIQALKTFVFCNIWFLSPIDFWWLIFDITSCTEGKKIFIDHDPQTGNSRVYELFIVLNLNNLRSVTKIDMP